ncbi:site-specific integrase [Qipengyuania sp. R86523]|uniref:site-specific integrase n=1 Tax=Qipengyuania sp. R86523 TaxID=3093862 RepID=UPI0037C85380
MFKLTRRKGSARWQVRKRWPSDVAPILRGEGFVKSTGEEDRKAAQAKLPFMAAEYERLVAEARAKLAEAPREELSEAEAHRMAAEFYRDMLPRYIVSRPVHPADHKRLLAETRSSLETARAMLGRNDFSPVAGVAEVLASQAGLSLPDDAPAWEPLHRMLMRAFVELHEVAAANLSGNPGYTPRDPVIREVPAAPEGAPASRTVEQLIDRYEADKAPGWSGSTKKAVRPVFRLVRDVFPGRGVDSITREEARGVVTLLEGLPVNMGRKKALEGMTVPEAVKKAAKLGLPTIKPKTINDGYLLHIASLFNWARKEQWVSANPFEGLSVFDPVDDEDRRDPFTVSQLQTVFTSAAWQEPWREGKGKAGDYWVPLLCLFHGLRNGEAAGLRVEDVGEEEGIHVIRLQPYGTRKLKTKGSRGTLALHPELVRLGFLRYVEVRRGTGKELLFPEGAMNSRGQVGAKIGERFSKLVKRLGLEGRKLGMHSFRHCFEDRLREAELPERTALALARRGEPGSGKVYGAGLSARLKAEAIAKIAYPGLDLSHLYP